MSKVTIKTKEEIEILRECGKRLGTIVREVGKMVAPGVTTDQLEAKAREMIREYGDVPAFLNYTPQGATRPYPAAMCVSINDEIIHGIPNEDPYELQEGDIVTLDLGLSHKGLVTDHAVTFPVGEIDKETRRLLTVTREALSSGIKAAVGGGRVGDIGSAIEKHANQNNFGIVQGLVGHGVGYTVHEDPMVPNWGRKGTGELLVPGMVLAIEPMFTFGDGEIVLGKDGYTYSTMDGTLACQFEHTVVITEKGPEILTKV